MLEKDFFFKLNSKKDIIDNNIEINISPKSNEKK